MEYKKNKEIIMFEDLIKKKKNKLLKAIFKKYTPPIIPAEILKPVRSGAKPKKIWCDDDKD
jgi:hypothetical protein